NIHGIEGRLWNDDDIGALRLMTNAVHKHGSLAGIELVHNGHHVANLTSRVAPIGVRGTSVHGYHPVQARVMDKKDIRDVRKWHREAAIRSREAGFDIVYVYAGHGYSLPMHFLSRITNNRIDEYGGSLENRVRFVRELIEDTKDAVGDTCAVAFRFAVDELLGSDGISSESEGRDIVEMLAELPDLWDVNISDWSNDSATSRFEKEGYQQPYTNFVKSVTTKPVVGVGRFTSPDSMVSMIKRGELDLIGAARPSIADPFLPKKIAEGRVDEIRECIGCNICVSCDLLSVPIRCTQNPTMGEEWRKGWHPEKIQAKKSDDNVLVIGAGPAGLECALALSKRGYQVTLAEATKELGGRLTKERRLPGLAEWFKVIEHRLVLLSQAANVEIYRDSELTVTDILEFDFQHIYIATGSYWRRDGLGRVHYKPVDGFENDNVLTPDDLLLGGKYQDGNGLSGKITIFDDEHYFMAGALAEQLLVKGLDVTIVTPAGEVSTWTQNTLEQKKIQSRLLTLGATIKTHYSLKNIKMNSLDISCVYTDKVETLITDYVVLVTERIPKDELYYSLINNLQKLEDSGIKTVNRIGDAISPGTIAQAIYTGHLEARALDEDEIDGTPFKCERTIIHLEEINNHFKEGC
ncbi:MAG: NADH:flavin oxidoreductase, partial [Gammaproteobacteria bacterium]